ncbi:MAG: aspartate-semialdehyde dehydrogenase, partial [Candidatus Poseidoniales archaeon]|nr:aspartate-semialdehyde dehydrogenase [Candidatus Poseidoniales archaeon]
MGVRKVAILGASGLVAQRFQQRLANHPWFELVAVYGSPRTAGSNLEGLEWHLPEPRPNIPTMKIRSMDSLMGDIDDFEVVFSALPSEVAITIEKPLAERGLFVFSNASTHRMDDDVPLIVADLNPHHLLTLCDDDSTTGFVACSTNCTIVPAALPLKPLWDFIGLDGVSIATEQSLSGGGVDLLTSFRQTNKHSADIPGEAEKMQEECLSLLGRVQSDGVVRPANFSVQVTVRRVNREYGHIVNVIADLHSEKSEQEVREWMLNYRSRPQALELPSAPDSPFIFVDDLIPTSMSDPATDLKAGMAVRISELQVEKDMVTFRAWSENTIRGAAGGTVLLA